MKKNWWLIGGCLLLVIIIAIITHALTHEKSTDTSEYVSPDAPAVNGEGVPADDRQGGQGYPVVRVRPMPPGYADEGQVPGGRPVISRPVPRPPMDPGYHPLEGTPQNGGQPVEIQPEDQGPPEDYMEQPPDEEAYEDGNPGEEPPQDGMTDE